MSCNTARDVTVESLRLEFTGITTQNVIELFIELSLLARQHMCRARYNAIIPRLSLAYVS